MITFKVWKTNRAIAVFLGADPLGSSKAKSMALTVSANLLAKISADYRTVVGAIHPARKRGSLHVRTCHSYYLASVLTSR